MPVALGDFVCLLSRFGVYAMLDVIKRHIIDIIGIVLAVSLFFFEGFAAFFSVIVLLFYEYLRIGFFVIVPMVFVMNIAAYKLIEKNKASDIIPALLGGTIGGYIAIHTANIFYCKEKLIRIFFRIFIWICILLITLFLLAFFRALWALWAL